MRMTVTQVEQVLMSPREVIVSARSSNAVVTFITGKGREYKVGDVLEASVTKPDESQSVEIEEIRGIKWHRINQENKHDLPPENKEVLLLTESSKPGCPNPLYVGYIKYAAGDKDSPEFIIPGYEGKAKRFKSDTAGELCMIPVIAWCDCLTGFSWSALLEYRKGVH